MTDGPFNRPPQDAVTSTIVATSESEAFFHYPTKPERRAIETLATEMMTPGIASGVDVASFVGDIGLMDRALDRSALHHPHSIVDLVAQNYHAIVQSLEDRTENGRYVEAALILASLQSSGVHLTEIQIKTREGLADGFREEAHAGRRFGLQLETGETVYEPFFAGVAARAGIDYDVDSAAMDRGIVSIVEPWRYEKVGDEEIEYVPAPLGLELPPISMTNLALNAAGAKLAGVDPSERIAKEVKKFSGAMIDIRTRIEDYLKDGGEPNIAFIRYLASLAVLDSRFQIQPAKSS